MVQTKDVGGFIKQNCLDCHNATEKSGGLDLATLPVRSESLESRNSWIRIYDRVHSGEMPPESKLTPAQREPFTNALRAALVAGGADRFVQLAHTELDRGRSYEQAMRVALRGILISPRFLMLDESPGMLDDYALAARLSYFFWSSPPDGELLRLASEGQLSNARAYAVDEGDPQSETRLPACRFRLSPSIPYRNRRFTN